MYHNWEPAFTPSDLATYMFAFFLQQQTNWDNLKFKSSAYLFFLIIIRVQKKKKKSSGQNPVYKKHLHFDWQIKLKDDFFVY